MTCKEHVKQIWQFPSVNTHTEGKWSTPNWVYPPLAGEWRTLSIHFVNDAAETLNASANAEDYGLLSDNGDNGEVKFRHYLFWDN